MLYDDRILNKAVSICRYARRYSPFFRERLSEKEPGSREAFASIPVTPRDVLFEKSPPLCLELLSGPLTDAVMFLGACSPGYERFCAFSHTELQNLVDVQGGILKTYGLTTHDIILNLVPSEPFSFLSHTLDRSLEKVGGLILSVGNAPCEKVFSWLERFGVSAIIAPSQVLIKLCQEFKNANIKAKIPHVIYSGELLSSFGNSLVKSVIGCEIVRPLWFGTPDSGPVGYSCHSNEPGVFHLLEDYQYLEIIDNETSQLVLPEKRGDLYITNLDRRMMPVIRLEMGLKGSWLTGTCSCGRQDRLFRVDMAWEQQKVLPVEEARILFEFLELCPELTDHWCLIRENDQRIIQIEARNSKDSYEKLRNSFREKLAISKISLDIQILPFGSLKRNPAGDPIKEPI